MMVVRNVARALRQSWSWGCLLVVLGGCASVPHAPISQAEPAQAEREHAAAESWRLHGRVAVRNDGDGGSGSVSWQQQPAQTRFELRAPVTGQGWTLSIDHGRAVLDGLEGGPRAGPDAVQLVRDAVGWELPLDALGWWVRGLRAPGRADIEFDPQGLPALIRQAGWQVEYKAWMQGPTGPMPRKLFARRGKAEVRLVVGEWQIP